LAQETMVSVGGVVVVTPVPLNAMSSEGTLLVTVTAPVTAPAVVGSKEMVIIAVAPGARVPVPPDTENPVPEAVTAVIITGAVPVDVSVTCLVVGVLRATLPKATLLALSDSEAVGADPPLSVIVAVFETPL
jgi:hypothetical protein